MSTDRQHMDCFTRPNDCWVNDGTECPMNPALNKKKVRVVTAGISAFDMDGTTLEGWQEKFQEAAAELLVPVDEVYLDVDTNDEHPWLSFYARRQQTPQEITEETERHAAMQEQLRENARKEIERLSATYPELMPYQVQEFP